MKTHGFSKPFPIKPHVVLLYLTLYCALAACLQAATITVTTTNDSGTGSLRDALANAADGDAIDFSATGIITLSSGELLVTKSVDIIGPGVTKLVIDGNRANRVLHAGSGIVVTISSLTITNGAATGAYPYDRGGGIFSGQSTLTVRECIVSGNSASQDGGGIFSDRATLNVVNCALSANSSLNGNGGGIANDGNLGTATLQIANCSITGNSAGNLGGGVLNQGESGLAYLLIDHTSLIGNTASQGGGIGNLGGTLVVSDSTLANNSALFGDGGGIASFGQLQSSTTAQIVNSTLSGNTANKGSGGAIVNVGLPRASASVRIVFSTLSGNSAGGFPGGGGGIANISLFGGSAAVQIGSTILNAGTAGEDFFNPNTPGTITSLGYNLSSDAGSGFLTATGDQVNTDPMLGPLQDNGGPTLTHALSADSPAIDAGDPSFTPPPEFDQRGPGFPRVAGDGIDIGAFEAPATAPPITEEIADIIALIRSMAIHDAIKFELIARLHKALISANTDKGFNACTAIRTFVALVHAQAGKKLTPDQAAQLINEANRIRAVLACP